MRVLIIAMMVLMITFGIVSAGAVAEGIPGLTNSAPPGYPILGVDQAVKSQASQQFLNDLVHQYGIHWDREDISWQPGWTARYNQLVEANISIIGILDSNSFQNSSWTLSNWKTEVSLALAQFPEIHVWEIWNEPELAQYQSGYENGSAYNYYTMLNSAYSIIKAYNSSDTVLGLDASIISGPLQQDLAAYQWFEQVWGYGAAAYCDAVSLHIFTGMQLLNYTSQYGLTEAQIVKIALSNYESLTKKPVWITETGIPSNNASTVPSPNNTPEKQAVFLDQMYTFLISKPYVKAIMWFSTFGNANPSQYDFGLFNSTSLAPEPALIQLENFVRLANTSASSTSTTSNQFATTPSTT